MIQINMFAHLYHCLGELRVNDKIGLNIVNKLQWPLKSQWTSIVRLFGGIA